MQIKSIFTILAASLSLAMAEDTTTTSTSTMTMTVTITKCNPTATNCPAHTQLYPQTNSSSVSAWPTAYSNSSTWAIPTKRPTATETSLVVVTPTKATTSVSSIPTSGAGALFLQSGLMLGILGAGVALVA